MLFNDIDEVVRVGQQVLPPESKEKELQAIDEVLQRLKNYKGNRETTGIEFVLYDEKGYFEHDLGRYDDSEESFLKCVELSNRLAENNIPSALAMRPYTMLAIVSFRRKRMQEMKRYADKGLALFRALSNGKAQLVKLPYDYKAVNVEQIIVTLESLRCYQGNFILLKLICPVSMLLISCIRTPHL